MAEAEDSTGDAPETGSEGPIRQQMERREQLRYLQEFMANPLLMDLTADGVDASTPADEIAARRSDLDYKIKVLEALLAMHRDERRALDAFGTAPDGQA